MGDLGAKEERTKAGARDAMELDLELEASSPSAELDSLKSASEESEREEIEAGPGEPRRALRASAHHAVNPLKTDDDAVIHIEYQGRIDLGSGKAVSAPLFQTGAEQYEWLNRIQAIGIGQNQPPSDDAPGALPRRLFSGRSSAGVAFSPSFLTSFSFSFRGASAGGSARFAPHQRRLLPRRGLGSRG